jgi:undecaprenyl diphosphate synthase
MTTPFHIAIIPDGNRRWAKARNLSPWKGHEQAIENFRSYTEWFRKNPKIGTLTVWCFSTENWKRDEKEVAMLMELLERYLKNEKKDFIKNEIRFLHSGRRDRIPSSLREAIEDVEHATAQFSRTLHLAVDYGGQDEIVRALEKMKGKEITIASIRENLDQPKLPDIDLIIRTSGETRTSNFFLWQTTYSEWIFSEKFFPDFSIADLEKAVTDLENRQRRFGA